MQKSPNGIAVFGGQVYVTSDTAGDIYRVPTAGGSGLVTVSTSERKPMGIVADATGVYGQTQATDHPILASRGHRRPDVRQWPAGCHGIALNSKAVFWQTSTMVVGRAK